MPVTRPRRRSNQRLAVIAASGTATAPVLDPITRPHSTYSCHGWVMTVVSAEPIATMISAAAHTRRTPKRSITAAANGAPRPYTKQVEGDRAADQRRRPPEGVLQRQQQHAGGGAEAGGGHQHHERGRHHHPRIVRADADGQRAHFRMLATGVNKRCLAPFIHYALMGTWTSITGSIRSKISCRLGPVMVRPWFLSPTMVRPGSGASRMMSDTAVASSRVPQG